MSDDLAPGLEDDKQLRRASVSVGQKCRQAVQHQSNYSKFSRSTLSSSDQQLFCGKI